MFVIIYIPVTIAIVPLFESAIFNISLSLTNNKFDGPESTVLDQYLLMLVTFVTGTCIMNSFL